MHLTQHPRVASAICALLVLAAIANSSWTTSVGAGADDQTKDAAAYARLFNVTPTEALQRLQIQARAGQLQEILNSREPGTFGGMWIDNSPAFRIVAAFTRNGDRVLPGYAAQVGLSNMAVATPVAHTLAELQQDLARVLPVSRAIQADVGLNVRQNRIDLYTVSEATLASALNRMGTALPSTVTVVHLTSPSYPLAQVYGGLPLDINGCTTGFGVFRNGTTDRGVTTAAHCNPGSNDSYQGIALPFMNGARGGSDDEQWYLGSNFQVLNVINDGLGGRFINSITPSSQQVVGGAVCHYGRAGGYNCGTIQSTAFSAGCEPNPLPTYVMVQPPSGVPGDSGGPMFLTNAAYGSIVCGGPYDIEVPVDVMQNGLGVTVLTSP